jgi:peptidoglycan/LPS O-acetylase OafA/YrhL
VIGASGLDRVGRVSLPLYLVHLPALTIAASLTVRRLTEIQPDQQPTIIALLALVAAAAAGWIFLLIDRVARAASRDIATGLAWHADPRVTVLPPARSAGPKSPQGWTR